MNDGTANGVKPSMPEYRLISTKDISEVRTKLLAKQKGICPICGREIKDPVLDHDHTSGAVRDTLCRNCNRFEGKVLQWAKTVPFDNIGLLVRLAKYWRRHQVNKHGLLHPNKITKRKRRKTNAKTRSTRSRTDLGSDRTACS